MLLWQTPSKPLWTGINKARSAACYHGTTSNNWEWRAASDLLEQIRAYIEEGLSGRATAPQLKFVFGNGPKHEDGADLRLLKQPAGSGQWLVLFAAHGLRRETGLRRRPDLSLTLARKNAAEARQMVQHCTDSITKREAERRDAERNLHLLGDVSRDAFEASNPRTLSAVTG